VAKITYDITSGDAAVSATGAIGSGVATATMTSAPGRIVIRATGFNGQSARIAVEDTNNVSAFSDAASVFVADIKGTSSPDGITISRQLYELPDLRFGSTNTKLRVNVTALSGGSGTVYAFVEQ
jgi:hypothetical protein